MIAKHILDTWELRSLNLLKEATIPQGVKASCTDTTNYGSVFTRDAVMAGIAGLLYDDQDIISGLQSTIEMLFKTRGAQGQIASNYKIDKDEIEHISFGTLSPKIDSATWYLVAIGLLLKRGYTYKIEYVESTISLLEAIEYNGKNLMYIPQGGNWADEYPYEGYILYDQVLRIWALELLGKYFNRNEWTEKAFAIKERIDRYYLESRGYYQCSYTPSGVNSTFDFAAHALLGMLDGQTENQDFTQALEWVNSHFLSKGKLPGAFYPVIDQNHFNWNKLSSFHLYDFKNKPHHYHNGGIWFIWLGWYALMLFKHNKKDALKQLGATSFEILNNSESFEFEEYFTADTLNPMGTQKLCYTATGILFLCKALKAENHMIDLF